MKLGSWVSWLALWTMLVSAPALAAAADGGTSPTATQANFSPELLTDTQRAWELWTERQFGADPDPSRYAGVSDVEKVDMENRWLTILEGPETSEVHGAINGLAALRSPRAIQPLLRVAMERREKNNRGRWMAVRALGLLGDQSAVPELCHLVYHGNQNTRLWAQISLVRLTGQNFGYDWKKWGEWWNAQGRAPAFSAEPIEWIKKPNEKIYGTREKQEEVDQAFLAKWKAQNGGAGEVKGNSGK